MGFESLNRTRSVGFKTQMI